MFVKKISRKVRKFSENFLLEVFTGFLAIFSDSAAFMDGSWMTCSYIYLELISQNFHLISFLRFFLKRSCKDNCMILELLIIQFYQGDKKH